MHQRCTFVQVAYRAPLAVRSAHSWPFLLKIVTFRRFSRTDPGDKRCRTSLTDAARHFVLSRTKCRTSSPHSLNRTGSLIREPLQGRFATSVGDSGKISCPRSCLRYPLMARLRSKFINCCRSRRTATAAVGGGGGSTQQCCTYEVSVASPYSVGRAAYQQLDLLPAAPLLSTARQAALWAALLKGGRCNLTRLQLDSLKRVGCP